MVPRGVRVLHGGFAVPSGWRIDGMFLEIGNVQFGESIECAWFVVACHILIILQTAFLSCIT
jgi:hypothetical protein